MKWKHIGERIVRTVSEPDHALLIELASAAVVLAWVAHWAVE